LRIDRPAEFFIMPQDLDDLRYALAFAEQEDLPLIVIGGNNPLVSDRGVQAVVVKLEGILSRGKFTGQATPAFGSQMDARIINGMAKQAENLVVLRGIDAVLGGSELAA
jgi:UDP-N-acetylenolpyruvoylglucosamine reductase